MDYKKEYLELKEKGKELVKAEKHFRNMVFMTAITGVVFNILDKNTTIPLSTEDGLKFNLYLLPMVFVAIFYLIYGYLWRANKVKGRLMFF